MGAMTLSGALCYGELAARFPEAGGSYVYLREIWGKPTAFLYGWMDLLVLDPGLTATFAVGLTSYFVYLVPLSPNGKRLFVISVVIILGLVNILGAKISANVLKILTILKIATLLFIIAFGFLSGFGNWSNFTPFFVVPKDTFGAFASGIVGAFFAFAGWWEVTRIAGEVENSAEELTESIGFRSRGDYDNLHSDERSFLLISFHLAALQTTKLLRHKRAKFCSAKSAA